MSTDRDQLTRDAVFDVLSSARRRYLLYYLREHGGEAKINELAREIASWENGIDPEELTSQDQKRVYVSLYQTHVPKLEELGIVEYDSESSVVRFTDRAREFDRYLTTEPGSRFPWQLYYLALSVLGAVLFSGHLLEVPPLDLVSTPVLGGAIILAFVVSAAVQYYLERVRPDPVPKELDVDR